jgi:hypothetical protein
MTCRPSCTKTKAMDKVTMEASDLVATTLKSGLSFCVLTLHRHCDTGQGASSVISLAWPDSRVKPYRAQSSIVLPLRRRSLIARENNPDFVGTQFCQIQKQWQQIVGCRNVVLISSGKIKPIDDDECCF